MENNNRADNLSAIIIKNNTTLIQQPNRNTRFAEFLLLFILMAAYWAQYTFIGDLVSDWGVNHIDLVTLPWDKTIPFSASWSFFYSSALFIPFIFGGIVFFRSGLDLLLAYRMMLTGILVLTIHYICYVSFPTATLIWKYPGFTTFWQQIQGPGWLNENTRFILSITSPGNSFPSYHIGSAWIILRYTFERSKLLGLIFLAWFIGMCIGTLTLKVHVIMDGVAGIIISELCYQLFKTHKIQAYLQWWITNFARKPIIWIYLCCALIVAPLVIYEFIHIPAVVVTGFVGH